MSSLVSKKIVSFGTCDYEGRRDNLKKQHFLTFHPGLLYIEKGEKRCVFFTKKTDDTKDTLEGESSTDIRGSNVGEDAQDLE